MEWNVVSVFFHCTCFQISDGIIFSGRDSSTHPVKHADRVWHEFMKRILAAKKIGPFFVYSNREIANIVGIRHSCENYVHSISDYFELTEKVRERIRQAKLEQVESWRERYDLPKDHNKLEERLRTIEQEYQMANQILDEIPSRILSLYQELIKNCPHQSPFAIYDNGLICSLTGNWDEAILEIQNLMKLEEKEKSEFLNSSIYQVCGEACLEVKLFHEAIEALTKAIKANPRNREAYFYRASAYFETGNFDEALQDYLMSDKGKQIPKSNIRATKEFTSALLNNVCHGAMEAAIDFVPSLCSSAYGLGKMLWAVHPLNPQVLENANEFANACYEMTECIADTFKNLDWETVNGCVDQIKVLYEQYNQLNDTEKGELIGFAVGKYGVDLFAGGAIIKSISACRKLRTANSLCNLESMAISNANKEEVITASLKHTSDRESFFKNVKIEIDKQNKHIVGKHNYECGKSIFEHSDPERLIKDFAGKGKAINNEIPGNPNYRELIDFGEQIGIWKDKNNTFLLPTTKGHIHYSKKGAHIVPAHPESK